MIEEVWKDVVGYEGFYRVSNTGKVKSLYRNKLLKPKIDKDGYHEYGLYKNKKLRHRRGHRLVAEAFIENVHNFPIINHKDGIKSNNHIDNLEWCTFTHNTVHGYKINPQKRIGRGFSDLSYDEIREAVELYKSGYSYTDLTLKYELEIQNSSWREIFTGRRYFEITGIKESILRDDPHPTTKIDKNITLDILDSVYNKHYPQNTLCIKYNLSPAQVSRIVNGTRWESVYTDFIETQRTINARIES